jgi:hypothetical protein
MSRINAWERTATRAIGITLGLLLVSTNVLADTFELDNGEKFDATVVEETEDSIIVEHPIFGRMTIPKSAIKEEEPVNPGLFGTRLLRGWERSVEFGFNGSSGNSDSIGINAGLRLFGEGDTYRSRLRAQYFYAKQRLITEQEKAKTTNNAFLDVRHDFLIFGDSPFYLWLNARYDYDEFQDFENRFTGQGGAGYEIYNNDTIIWLWNLGAGVNYQGGLVDDAIGEFVTGMDFSWKIVEGQSIKADTYYYADFERWSDFRLISNLLYEISLGWVDGLALNAGLKNEYRNEVLPPVAPNLRNKNNNLQYFGGLTYNF